jgi:hypothetical protein
MTRVWNSAPKISADLSKTTRVLTIMLAEDWRGELLLADFRGGFSKTTPASSANVGTPERKATPYRRR